MNCKIQSVHSDNIELTPLTLLCILRPARWHKAKKVQLTPGQTEVKIDLPLPIVASNLMIEFSDFYENYQASTETLQCPRCSASVPANPGVCGNCGENVYQCHKCRWAVGFLQPRKDLTTGVYCVFIWCLSPIRSINYDEKDPFLCNACGFCKYARFDFMLYAKPCCAVDPIENEEDRKKVSSLILFFYTNHFTAKEYKEVFSLTPFELWFPAFVFTRPSYICL